MLCNLGNCERSGNLLVLIIPGWDRGSRRLISITSMSCPAKVNTVLNIFLYEYMYDMRLYGTNAVKIGQLSVCLSG